MTEFFIKQNFSLAYYHFEDGIFDSDVPHLFVDGETNKTLVIAARGDSPIDYFHMKMNPDQILARRNNGNYVGLDITVGEIYNACKSIYGDRYLQSVRESIDSAKLNLLDETIELCKKKMVHLLVVLFYDKANSICSENNASLISIKTGGPELVVEFMFSNFAHNSSKTWVNKVDQSVADFRLCEKLRVHYNPLDESFCGIEEFIAGTPTSQELEIYENRWNYDFSLSQKLDRMNDEERCINEDGYDVINYYHYNINLKKITLYNELINIPTPVYSILTDDQKNILPGIIRKIISEHVDEIGHDFFNQKFENFKSHMRHKEAMIQERLSNLSIYDALDNGTGEVYLGDGISIDSNGVVHDDND